MKIEDALYKNRLLYYKILEDFLANEISAWEAREQFLRQRNQDLDTNKQNGYNDYYDTIRRSNNEQAFMEQYFWKLYNYTPKEDVTAILQAYVEGAKKFDIRGPLFFSGIYDDLSVNFRDYYPRHPEWVEPEHQLTPQEYIEEECIDDEELRKRVLVKYQILTDNKERWV